MPASVSASHEPAHGLVDAAMTLARTIQGHPNRRLILEGLTVALDDLTRIAAAPDQRSGHLRLMVDLIQAVALPDGLIADRVARDLNPPRSAGLAD